MGLWQVIAVTSATVAFTCPAVPAGAGSSDRVPHPERDYMGSTIQRHAGPDGYEPLPHVQRPGAGRAVPGIDVSNWQGGVNWAAVARSGVRFAYLKATEGATYTDPLFVRNYRRSMAAGVIRGAYHFALPNRSSGAEQGRFFVESSGDWKSDGKTLPPVLDIEYNPYGPRCYGLSKRQMVAWISAFSATVKRLAGRYPLIYTTTDWWRRCTGNHRGFGGSIPLWIARWGAHPHLLPDGWSFYTFWQHTSKGRVPGIRGHVARNVFNGSRARLRAFATCTDEDPC